MKRITSITPEDAFFLTASDFYPADMRKLDMIDKEGEERDELIAKKKDEKLKDMGTFLEWFQDIEIDDKNYALAEDIHEGIINDDGVISGTCLHIIYEDHCEELATKEVDGGN